MKKPTTEEEAASAIRKDPRVKSRLRDFLVTDNTSNFLYVARAYLIAGLMIASAIAFFELRESLGLSFWWNIPVFLISLLVVGASQHQLAGGIHEAVHHTLFKNRKLNELISDWFCGFPILTSTYQFRLYHLAHHQFVNDPERDPDFALLKDSGHWMDFPVAKSNFLWMMIRQLLLIDLIRYILVRVKYNTVGSHSNSPYRKSDDQPRRIPSRIVIFYFMFVIASVFAIQKWGGLTQVILIPLAGWGVVTSIFYLLPDRFFEEARIKPVFHPRWMYAGLTLSFTLIVSSLAYVQISTGFMALRYFSLMWYGATVTTLPFFLILRQLIQHGNADRGWITNTRVFRMNFFVRYAVFPFGMDYHLPHHMYASVPHYRLKALHRFMMTIPEYSDHCRLVDNYIIPKNRADRKPTVLEVLGPEHATNNGEIHIDDSVLDDWEVDEKEEILLSGRPAPVRP